MSVSSPSVSRSPAAAVAWMLSAVAFFSLMDAGMKLPYIKLAEARWRGYLRCTVTPQAWRTDLQTVDTIARPDAQLSTLMSFAVEAGRPGPQSA